MAFQKQKNDPNLVFEAAAYAACWIAVIAALGDLLLAIDAVYDANQAGLEFKAGLVWSTFAWCIFQIAAGFAGVTLTTLVSEMFKNIRQTTTNPQVSSAAANEGNRDESNAEPI